VDVRSFGRVNVILGKKNGKYPYGNSILIDDDITALIDPSLMIRENHHELPKIDMLFNSHYHEDHGVGNSLFPEAPLYMHPLDAPALRSIETLFEYYGMDQAATEAWKPVVVEKYFYETRNHIVEFTDSEVFDFGHTRMRVMHTPGHTGGHCCFFFEEEGLLFVADWDLTWFGPVYGDVTSDLAQAIASLQRIRDADTRALVSFHEAGVCEENQRAIVTQYLEVIYDREQRLLDFLAEPRTLAEIVKKRIVYRKDYDNVVWLDAVEKNSMTLHLDLLMQEGRVEWDGARYVRR
jgi:glyoxylase-like metal-dependent hydrolase (beta-lactamase superfamily II)